MIFTHLNTRDYSQFYKWAEEMVCDGEVKFTHEYWAGKDDYALEFGFKYHQVEEVKGRDVLFIFMKIGEA